MADHARRLSVSGVARPGVGQPVVLRPDRLGRARSRERFIALTDAVWRVRAYGDFWSYCLVAEGAVDIAAEPEVKLWDLAPLDILVREAGGTFTSLDGAPGPHGGSARGDQRTAARPGAQPAEADGVNYANSTRRTLLRSKIRSSHCPNDRGC